MIMSDLNNFGTEELAAELLGREDFLGKDGSIPRQEVYELFEKGIPIMCTDGIAVRQSLDGAVEAMVIRRNTLDKGKLCSVGGRIFYGESVEEAVRRHFMDDLGCNIRLLTPWRTPFFVLQTRPIAEGPKKDFGLEPSKHAVSMYHLVALEGEPKNFGSTAHGGQEASGIEWFSLKDFPPDDAFGFGQHLPFRQAFIKAEEILKVRGRL